MDNIVIDKIDKSSNIARVEFYGVMIEIPFTDLPSDCKEGDVLGLARLSSARSKEVTRKLEQELFG